MLRVRTTKELLLPQNGGDRYLDAVNPRLGALKYHVREYYWLDLQRLNEIYRFKGDEFGKEVANKFNIYPESIPGWLTEWLPETGGYLVGNLGPGRMEPSLLCIRKFAIDSSFSCQPRGIAKYYGFI